MNYHDLGDDLRRIFSLDDSDPELDRIMALAEEALDALDIDAEPPVSRVFPVEQPNYARDMPPLRAGTLLSATARDVMDRWLDGNEWEREQIDRDLARREADLRSRIEARGWREMHD